MKLEVGMYVRTEYGIAKIKYKTDEYLDCDNTIMKSFGENYFMWDIQRLNILKASHNIIDLIEEKDVIKFEYDGTEYICDVYAFRLNKNDLAVCCEGDIIHIKEDNARFELKSIVTKEQFESMSYKVGE